ncbi:MAG TPA: hypothetical protein VH142_11570 [Polyangiaceae bacterium]|nr:hypothetical protein [Polyangiaceae bacterium]
MGRDALFGASGAWLGRAEEVVFGMLRRWCYALVITMFALVAISACDDGPYGRYRRDFYPYDPCQSYSSCGSCTPVLGCGWCSVGSSGTCVSDPDYCGTNAFSWTWDPSGCPGAVESDGGTDGGRTPSLDAGTSEPKDATPNSSDAKSDAATDAAHD